MSRIRLGLGILLCYLFSAFLIHHSHEFGHDYR